MTNGLKIIAIIFAIVIISSTFTGCFSSAQVQETTVRTELDFDVKDRDEDLVPATFLKSDSLGYEFIYDCDYLPDRFGEKGVSVDDLIESVNSNPSISDYFRPFIINYCRMITEAYPEADLRILRNNLKTLEVVECETSVELMKYTLSADSYACYMNSENKIYLMKDYEFTIGTWDYQVLIHELTHAARSHWEDTDGDGRIDFKSQFPDNLLNYTSIYEAMNSIAAVRMYDAEERDIAYQLQSNYFCIILDCIDNYTLTDYFNHSMSYFASKLDEATGYHNYASDILRLMEEQYDDYHSEWIEIPEENYYPIYDYICEIYFAKYIDADMNEDEKKAICDALVEKVTFDVPAEYHIDTERFYSNLENYHI